jgi:hypothetical protein
MKSSVLELNVWGQLTRTYNDHINKKLKNVAAIRRVSLLNADIDKGACKTHLAAEDDVAEN